MKCMHCKGGMKRKTAPYHIDRKGYHLVLDAVPAWVCAQCGEAYFEESDVDSIQNVIQTLDQQTSKPRKSA
jgi:YgiT-type zinc finger domain-containing protein